MAKRNVQKDKQRSTKHTHLLNLLLKISILEKLRTTVVYIFIDIKFSDDVASILNISVHSINKCKNNDHLTKFIFLVTVVILLWRAEVTTYS